MFFSYLVEGGTGEAVCLVFFSFVFLFGIFAPSISLLGVTFNYLKFSILSKDPTYRENGSSGKEAGCSLCQSSVCYAGTQADNMPSSRGCAKAAMEAREMYKFPCRRASPKQLEEEVVWIKMVSFSLDLVSPAPKTARWVGCWRCRKVQLQSHQ